MAIFHKEIESTVGTLRLVASESALVAIIWENERRGRIRRAESQLAPEQPLLVEGERQLADYFAGRRRRFDLPLALTGSAFEQKVWRALLAIPFGATRSYGAIASTIGLPTGARAVGAAVGKNPLAIVVPCHRVIGADGSLTGFAGGLEVKAALLALEGRHYGAERQPAELPLALPA